jgi:hypothetical protein
LHPRDGEYKSAGGLVLLIPDPMPAFSRGFPAQGHVFGQFLTKRRRQEAVPRKTYLFRAASMIVRAA